MTTASLDLGCGAKQRPGFVGVDRFVLPGVHVVADLDAPSLPFRDNCFDLIVAFHSLEHVSDLMSAMGEIWRVGKAGAQVVVGAPYSASHLNTANPYHKQVFNEHTPRFWTSAPHCAVDAAEWQEPPFGSQWGLAASDHSEPRFDLRCLRMEFFYFQPYWRFSGRRRRQLRKHQLNVCEQVLYNLAVFKPPMTEDELIEIASRLYFPPELDERRQAARRSRRSWRSWW